MQVLVPKRANIVQIFKLLIYTVIAHGQPKWVTSHMTLMLHGCIAGQCRKKIFFLLVQVEPHKSLKLLHSTRCWKRYQPHCSQFLEPWPQFSREGKLCNVSYCTSQRTGSPGINCPPGGNLPADSLLSKPASGVQGPGGSLGLGLSSVPSVLVHIRGSAGRSGFRWLIQTALAHGNSAAY